MYYFDRLFLVFLPSLRSFFVTRQFFDLDRGSCRRLLLICLKALNICTQYFRFILSYSKEILNKKSYYKEILNKKI